MLKRVRELADSDGPPAVVVPVKEKEKSPLVRHRGNAFGIDDSEEFFRKNMYRIVPGGLRVGFLLRRWLVLDFDGAPQYEKFKARFGEEVASAPRANTRRGVHVYFKRTPETDALDIWDRPLVDPRTGAPLDIDCKTLTNSVKDGHYTGSLILCPPSATYGKAPEFKRHGNDYSWQEGASLVDVDPKPLSSRIAKWIVKHSAQTSKKRSQPPRADDRPKKARVEPEVATHLVVKKFSDEDIGDASAMFATGARLEVTDDSADFYTPFKTDAACPICMKGAKHNNQFYVAHRPDGLRVLRSFSPHCVVNRFGKMEGVPVPFRKKSLERYQGSFIEGLRPCSVDPKSIWEALSLKSKMTSADKAFMDDTRLYLHSPKDMMFAVLQSSVDNIGTTGLIMGKRGDLIRVTITGTPWVRGLEGCVTQTLGCVTSNALRKLFVGEVHGF